MKAEHYPQALTEYWDTFLATGSAPWTEDHERRAKSMFTLQRQMAQATAEEAAASVRQLAAASWSFQVPQILTPAPDAPMPASEVITFKQAAEQYCTSLKARRLSIKHVSRAESVFKQIYASGIIMPQTPLPQVDRHRLTKFVAHFLSRPESRRTGEPLAVQSVSRPGSTSPIPP